MYDEILFPTNGSDGAELALTHALELVETNDARLHVLYVVDTTYLGAGAAEITGVQALRESGRQLVDETVDRITDAGIEATDEIRDGDPYSEILDYADAAAIDMIVMGTRGRRGLDRYLLGSVTEKVVRTADVPVLTVRLSEDG